MKKKHAEAVLKSTHTKTYAEHACIEQQTYQKLRCKLKQVMWSDDLNKSRTLPVSFVQSVLHISGW